MSRLLKIILLITGLTGVRRLWKRRSSAPPDVPAAAGETEDDEQTSWLQRLPLKRWLKEVAAILGVMAVGGFLVAASGIIPITASSGHWAITRWFLSFSMHRSVATHTLGMDAPPLDDPALVIKGAGHYETGCRPCHGSPALRQPRIAAEMTAEPPYLPSEIPKWEDEELFYIVEHGVKFTGMPAWPAREREDEIWAMVAFLRELPGMSAEEYRRLAEGDTPGSGEPTPIHSLLSPQEVPPAVTLSCARCHGVGGHGRGAGAFPRLAGQKPAYLLASLQAYAQGERHSGIMQPVAAGLDDEAIRELARYYSRQDVPAPARTAGWITPDAIARGDSIAHRGIPRLGVPSCVDCHGPGTAPTNPLYPLLAGQYADYLVLQLDLFKEGRRGGSPFARIMHESVDRMKQQDLRDVAAYYASLSLAAHADSLGR